MVKKKNNMLFKLNTYYVLPIPNNMLFRWTQSKMTCHLESSSSIEQGGCFDPVAARLLTRSILSVLETKINVSNNRNIQKLIS